MPLIHCKGIDNPHWENGLTKPYKLCGAVHIWRLQLSASLPLLPRCLSVLNDAERSRTASYHHEKDKDRFILSRGILRWLLSEYAMLAPEKIEMVTGENKKPFLQANGTAIHYNVAHSGNLVLIAIADAPVGIDVEYIDPAFGYTDILPACFSNEEATLIQNAEAPHYCFYTLWTRKEALLKATAKGIDDGMCSVPCIDGTHHVLPGIIGSEQDWAVNNFDAATGYMGCVALSPSVMKIVFADVVF